MKYKSIFALAAVVAMIGACAADAMSVLPKSDMSKTSGLQLNK